MYSKETREPTESVSTVPILKAILLVDSKKTLLDINLPLFCGLPIAKECHFIGLILGQKLIC